MRYRAVIFDLWDTLVDWPIEAALELTQRIATHFDLDDETFMQRWHENYHQRETGPLAAAYEALGVPSEHIGDLVSARHDLARRSLIPREGAVEALDELRARGHRLGLISVCSEDVPAAWPETPLASRFHVTTFSSECGVMKPEPEIYLRTARALAVDPSDALYVGDGANDELAGAARVGMTPVLILPEGRRPFWEEAHSWDGLRIRSVPEVLDLA